MTPIADFQPTVTVAHDSVPAHGHYESLKGLGGDSADHRGVEPQGTHVGTDGGGQGSSGSHPEIAPAVSLLIITCRQRRHVLKLRKAIVNNLYSQARSCVGFSTDDDDEKNRKAQCAAAKAMVDGIVKGKTSDAPAAVVSHVSLAIPSLGLIASQEKAITKLIATTASELPVWESWGKAVRGFGPLGLGLIVGECGDLGNYPTVGKLWKRMGVAVMEGNAQGHPPGGAGKDEWIAHGYNPARRSVLWMVGDGLIKQGELYRDIYLERKAIESERVETKMHAHRRAQRYMEKRLLRDLWAAWRRG